MVKVFEIGPRGEQGVKMGQLRCVAAGVGRWSDHLSVASGGAADAQEADNDNSPLVSVRRIPANRSRAITSFSPDSSVQEPGAPFKVEFSRFLGSILLALGVFAAILILTLFAAMELEHLALALKRSDISAMPGNHDEQRIASDDALWQR